jgi:hypothetical protein
MYTRFWRQNNVLKDKLDHNLTHDFTQIACDPIYFALSILVVEFILICPGQNHPSESGFRIRIRASDEF